MGNINNPTLGDLIEIGWDIVSRKPYIGVVTELTDDSVCILVNGRKKWCTLKEMKKINRRHSVE